MPILLAEPEMQTQGSPPTPAPPVRTAVGTDDGEKPPCRWCGHTKTEHMGPRCKGTSSMGGQCICTDYEPPKDKNVNS